LRIFLGIGLLSGGMRDKACCLYYVRASKILMGVSWEYLSLEVLNVCSERFLLLSASMVVFKKLVVLNMLLMYPYVFDNRTIFRVEKKK
jgi:hypothetical protein